MALEAPALRVDMDPLTRDVIGAAIEVHRALGPGLLESTYRLCLGYELQARGIPFRAEVDMPIVYRGFRVESAYRADLVIAESVIVEIKAVESLLPVHQAQLLTYLKLSGFHTGLLINFHTQVLRDGIKRIKL